MLRWIRRFKIQKSEYRSQELKGSRLKAQGSGGREQKVWTESKEHRAWGREHRA